jgi:hypothetical protein
MEETTLNLGLDPGFGAFKAALVDPTGARIAAVPSVVGVGETDLGMLSLGSVGRRSRRAQPDEVTFQGVTYLVGEEVARYARPVERMDFLRLSDGPELRALFYDVVFRLLGAAQHPLSVMAGLPVEVMADRQQAQSTLRAMRRWMVGPHAYQINGSEVALTVTDVQVMAQPAGAVFAWGLDDRGRWTRARADLKAPIAVCDIGYNTLDLFTVQGGEVIGRFTGGDTAGMRRSAELILAAVRGSQGLALSLHEADALLRARRPTLYTAGGAVDLGQLVQQALDATAAAVVTYVERRWGNGRQFPHLLFTGGGAEALRKTLLEQYPHGVVLPEPVTANALGLARYAVRAFRR